MKKRKTQEQEKLISNVREYLLLSYDGAKAIHDDIGTERIYRAMVALDLPVEIPAFSEIAQEYINALQEKM